MVRDGQLVRNRRDAYCLVNKRDLIAGRVIGHPDGFGFVKPDEGGDDLFLTRRRCAPVPRRPHRRPRHRPRPARAGGLGGRGAGAGTSSVVGRSTPRAASASWCRTTSA
jgi:ribonuclease R